VSVPATTARTTAEHEAALARNLAFRAARARQNAELPVVTISQLWRKAGGGTPGFNPPVFAALLTSEHWAAVGRCEPGSCGNLPPHLCWWSAIRASVQELRHHRPARTRQQDSLFDVSETEGNA